jgi:membrane-bound lytic murein transglycosylase D
MFQLACFSPLILLLLLILVLPSSLLARGQPFPVPAGLESAVEFWKQIFTRHSFGEVVLFDPVDPRTIYGVVRAPENDQGRALIERERARFIAEYDIADEEARIRSQRGAKEHFAEGLRIAGRYIGEMKKIFREEGLPEQLAYLPLVESSFNIRARSSAGALGMWQFMPETGKKFLRIDGSVDERRDPMASTRAAARLLKQNYRLLDNQWPLAITAYNHGTEGIFRGIKAVESDDLVDLIKRYQSPTFGFASKNFYAEFLAVVDIASKQDAYFPFLRLHAPTLLREIEVARSAPLHGVLKPAAISHADFFEWNPALDSDIKAIPAGYRVKLPEHKFDAFLSALRRAVAPAAKKLSGAGKPGGAMVQSGVRATKAKASVAVSSSGTSKVPVVRKRQPPARKPAVGVRAPVKRVS